ncbi:hypothetical protein D3C72_1372350 [compost metagenome]
MQLALADTSPADGVEVIAIDQPAKRRKPGGAVAVHVIEGAARVETGVEAKLYPGRQFAAQAEAGPRHAPIQIAQGVAW